MRFLLDANMPHSAVTMLAELGFSVEHISHLGLGAAPDAQIAEVARRSDAALITRDLDFADIRQYPPHLYSGLIVLRVPEDTISAEIVKLLRRFASDRFLVANLQGRLANIEQNRVRFRPGLV